MLWRALFGLLLSTAVSRGDLIWENPVQEFQRRPEDRQLAVNFAFKNSGAQAVKITAITSSCGCCTNAELAKKTYLPGESGTLAAKFTFEGRRGLQTKFVTVATDDGKSTPLTFKCLILDDPVTLDSSLVLWRVGEAAAAREVRIGVLPQTGVQITSVASSNPRITAALATVKAGEKYAVSIRPADTAQPVSGDVFVQTNFPPEGPKAYTIHVRVK